ncbi:ATP-binding protein [Clostridium sp.]|uniref:PAS domain-containing sensor histidine kinase n=1 Tax=Clostridium sp. TaxID=1506 RepID=UPI003F2F4DDA
MKYKRDYLYNNTSKILIKYIIILNGILLFLITLAGMVFDIKLIGKSTVINDIDGINFVMGVIAISCCSLYYYMKKNEEFFILTLSYVCIFIEYIFLNEFLLTKSTAFLSLENMIISPFIIRVFFLTIIILKIEKLKNIILSNKGYAILTTIILNLLLVILESDLRINGSTIILQKFFTALNIVSIVYYYYLLTMLAKKAVIKNEFFYSVVMSSISIFTIRRIFVLNIFKSSAENLLIYNRVLSFIGFLILIVGLFIEMFRRVNETERLNKKVINSEKKLMTITENIKDLILMEDENDRFTYINKAVSLKLGYEKDELDNQHYTKVLHSEKNIICDKDRGITYLDQMWKTKSGEIFPTETMISDIRDDENNIIGKMVVARDCSLRERVENLNKKYDEIKEVEKIRGQFFANLSHEMRTPINIIYSCIQLLESQKQQGDAELAMSYKKYDNTIKQNCFRMLRLVNNLVDITKIDSGFIKMNFVNYDIVSLIENITLSIIPYVETKEINVIFDTFEEELEVKCDPESIERVMLNLLANAVKFTELGGNIFVEVSSTEEIVTIKVKDDGIGIAKEFRDAVFERFVQTDKSLNRRKEGSGIGLALAKSLIELHEGRIYIADNDDDGSEFVIELPNVKMSEEKEESKNIIESKDKTMIEKISIEFSDIYDLF